MKVEGSFQRADGKTIRANFKFSSMLVKSYSFSGHYLYLEASAPAEPGYKGRLASRLLTDRTTRCLSFYYHMYGSNMGALSVFFEGAQTKTRVLIWQRVGEQGNFWKEGMVTLIPEEDYKVSKF